jgi:hypothetical protein
LINEIGESCSPPFPRAAGENSRKTGFLHTKAYMSKPKKNLTYIVEYSKRRDSRVHHTEKSTLLVYYECPFFAAKSMRAILCSYAILCALVDHPS